ncbi:hypothetical protein ACVWVY_006892 [Bradyrhizobium sp. URHC0002]
MRGLLVVVLALVSQCGDAYAWGDEGHKIVCEIAFRLHQPDTRSAVVTCSELGQSQDAPCITR